MKTRILSFMASAVATVALLTGCSTENDIENGKDGLASLELSSVSSSDMLTRAVIDGTNFPQTGEIGLFLYKDETAETPYGDSGYTNVKYAYNSTRGKWTASPSIKVGSTPGYLYGYYPYSSTATDVKEIPVASSLNGDDVMYATKQAVNDNTASQTAITMNHALARVSITVINNGYTGKAELSKIKFSGAKIAQEGTLNALDGKITAEKSSVTLDVTGNAQTITAAGTTYECLLVPSDAISTRQDLDLTLTIDDIDKEAHLTGNNGVIIAQGTKSNITIALSDKGISVQTVSVKDWNVVEVGGYTVTVKIADGIDSDDIMARSYVDGDKVIVKAISLQNRYLVCKLEGDAQCERTIANGKFTFTISNIGSNIEAVLGYSIVTISVSSDSNGKVCIGGDESKTSGKFYEGQQVVIHAAPNDKFRLYRWNDNNRETSRTITVGATDVTYSASFIPQDMIPGLFTVDANKKQVFFSKGNLYCSGVEFYIDKAADNYGTVKSMANAQWGFEANQYDTTPNGNRDNNHISHFMWCSTAEKAIALQYNSSWNGEGPFFAEKDFTVNGVSTWRTLTGGTNGEWKFLIDRKGSEGNALYNLGVKVCGSANCLILLPDDWEWDANTVGTEWQTEYSESTTVKWSTMENAGAVCLPAAGYRSGKDGDTYVKEVGVMGEYWSSSHSSDDCAYELFFSGAPIDPADSYSRFFADAVRLVTEVK